MEWTESHIDKCIILLEAKLRALFEKTCRAVAPPKPVEPATPATTVFMVHRISAGALIWPHKEDLRAFYDHARKQHVSLATTADRVAVAKRFVQEVQFRPAGIKAYLSELDAALGACDRILQRQEEELIKLQDYDEAKRQGLARVALQPTEYDLEAFEDLTVMFGAV